MTSAPLPRAYPCALQYVAALTGACPDAGCPFWERTAAAEGRCAFAQPARLDRRALAEWAAAARSSVQCARTERERDEVRRTFLHALRDPAPTVRLQ